MRRDLERGGEDSLWVSVLLHTDCYARSIALPIYKNILHFFSAAVSSALGEKTAALGERTKATLDGRLPFRRTSSK